MIWKAPMKLSLSLSLSFSLSLIHAPVINAADTIKEGRASENCEWELNCVFVRLLFCSSPLVHQVHKA
jgi:hypothetical protein